MRVYLIVRSKSLVSLLLEVTEFPDPGGGVCLYLRKNLIYKICLKYSNSVCDLLIVKIISPDLIIILVYRPPSSPLSDFDDIITKTKEFILSLPASTTKHNFAR